MENKVEQLCSVLEELRVLINTKEIKIVNGCLDKDLECYNKIVSVLEHVNFQYNKINEMSDSIRIEQVSDTIIYIYLLYRTQWITIRFEL